MLQQLQMVSKVFEMQTRVNCWAHVHRSIETHMHSIINYLLDTQLFPSAKWTKVNGTAIEKFLEYFSDRWCKKGNNGWYEGFAPGILKCRG
ncbi:unnamed protein product [Brachionus calyciflorus]|uniref:MULE transposase domain-containing protein n=1 Tax=Brachionus calyciflorus TaxID=104777 RepID=A0A814RVU8_9BILA|nr:unnamed protein product [Brachionus calyciflorus]